MVARWWLLRVPVTIRIIAGYALLTPFLLSMPYAMFGHPPDPFSGLSGLGGIVGTMVGARLRDREFWHLDKEGRRRVREVQLTGQASGDPQLDRIAVERLSVIVKNHKVSTVSLGVVCVLMLLTPAVAAVRTGHGWWLIASLPGVLGLALWFRARRGNTSRMRLDRLVDQIG